MSTERFRPAVTVAAVVECDGRYLLVEEHTPGGLARASATRWTC
jgi:hypothetical protein